MGAPMGNKNAAGSRGGMKQRGKKSGFRNTLKKRHNAKLSQRGKKSGLKTIRRTSSTGTSIHTFSTKKSNKSGRSTLYQSQWAPVGSRGISHNW